MNTYTILRTDRAGRIVFMGQMQRRFDLSGSSLHHCFDFSHPYWLVLARASLKYAYTL